MDKFCIVVEYVYFAPDNHQGGSGKWIEKEKVYAFGFDQTMREIKKDIKEDLEVGGADAFGNWKDWKVLIKSMRLS